MCIRDSAITQLQEVDPGASYEQCAEHSISEIKQLTEEHCGEPVSYTHLNGDFMLNLLQCRPLYVGPEGGGVKVPLLKKENCFFDIHDACMGHSVCRKLDGAVLIDPKAYYEYPYARCV